MVPVVPAFPSPAGPGCQSGAGAEEAEGISGLADCAGLINVPEREGTQESASGPRWQPEGLGQTPPLSLPEAPEPFFPTPQGCSTGPASYNV